MEKETISLELPKPVIEWYRRIAEYYEKSVEDMLIHELVDTLAAYLDEPNFLAEICSVDLILESGLPEILKEHSRQITWIDP